MKKFYLLLFASNIVFTHFAKGDSWETAVKDLEFLHRSSPNDFSSLIPEGGIMLNFKIIHPDNPNTFVSYLLVVLEEGRGIMIRQLGIKKTIVSLRNSSEDAKILIKYLVDAENRKLDPYPSSEDAGDAFGGTSYSIIALTSIKKHSYLRLGKPDNHKADKALKLITEKVLDIYDKEFEKAENQ